MCVITHFENTSPLKGAVSMAVVVVVVCTAHCSNCNLEGFNFPRFELKDVFACFKFVY